MAHNRLFLRATARHDFRREKDIVLPQVRILSDNMSEAWRLLCGFRFQVESPGARCLSQIGFQIIRQAERRRPDVRVTMGSDPWSASSLPAWVSSDTQLGAPIGR